jgi:hypothetical protein
MKPRSEDRLMRDWPTELGLDQPTAYRIVVEGRLDESWSEWFGGLEISVESSGSAWARTTLHGIVSDQAGLHGILERIRDLGLPLVSVARIPMAGDRKGAACGTDHDANQGYEC